MPTTPNTNQKHEILRLPRLERFVVERGVKVPLSEGFLLESDSGRWNEAAGLIPLLDLREARALVLVGESGAGKTWALRELANEADQSTWINLRDVRSPEELKGRINAARISSDQRRCEFFLDGADESTVPLWEIAATLRESVRGLPPEDVRLRIACRPALGVDRIVEECGNLGLGSARLVELTPLRFSDFKHAAQKTIVPSEEDFRRLWQDLRVAGLQSLAAWPLTLDLILQHWSTERRFPSGRVGLMESAMLRLAGGEAGRLGPEQRLLVAGRLAAVEVLGRGPATGGHPALRHGISTDDVVGAPYEEFRVGQEREPLQSWMVREVMEHSGLTHASGEQQTWTHWSHAEYLAARWLLPRLSWPQWESLLRHPADPHGLIPPHLQGLASWVCSLDRDGHIRRKLMRMDPEAWLGGADGADEAEREEGVAILLDEALSERFVERFGDHMERYPNLAHLRLADQLRVVIHNQRAASPVRKFATHVAWACKLAALVPTLLDVVEDLDDDQQVRESAAYAAESGAANGAMDEQTERRWRSLLHLPPEADPNEQIRGVALAVLWDAARLGAEELFAELHDPRRPAYFGSYQRFCGRESLVQEVFQRWGEFGLACAVRWAATTLDDGLSRSKAADACFALAWAHVNHPAVATAIRDLVRTAGVHANLRRVFLAFDDTPLRLCVLPVLADWIASEDLAPSWGLSNSLDPADVPC